MSTILIERQGPVLAVTLNRPEARNAFDHDMVVTLRDVFAGAGTADDRPRAVLLQAAGATFCAGGDLNDMRRLGRAGREDNLAAARELGEMFRAVRLCPAPVIARVQGGAFGGGVGLACACDIVVAGPQAFFALTEARLGLVAGVISPLVIGRLGPARARLHCLLGERIDAREAHRIGLVDVLAGEGELDGAVAGAVRSLLQGGPEALGRIKELVEGAAALPFADSLEYTAGMIAEARTTPQALAALDAFFAKEPSPWACDLEEWTRDREGRQP
ncbi:MAG: enoyl-CoA hydratase/isomerase family protein [bacterium]|nr:enoyl-CoA hydratase/isomerase family protein [bacterium]